jgi:hypothetical protein
MSQNIIEFNFDCFFDYDIQGDIFPKMDVDDSSSCLLRKETPLSLYFLFDDISKYKQNIKISKFLVESESLKSILENENNKKNKDYINNFKNNNINYINQDDNKIRLCNNSIYCNKKKLIKNNNNNNKKHYNINKSFKEKKEIGLIEKNINYNYYYKNNNQKNNQKCFRSLFQNKPQPIFNNFILTPFVFIKNYEKEKEFLNKKHPVF